MNVSFLKAGNGDAILISHGVNNILIDGGNDSSFLLERVKLIFDRNEVLDLVIITHHDDDHIRGIIDLLTMIDNMSYDKKGSDLIKKVMFNSPSHGKKESDQHFLSYRQAYQTESLLEKIGVKWESCTENKDTIEFGDLKISFLSPTEKDVQEYKQNQGAFLTSDYRSDWKTPLHLLESHVDDDSQDNSLYNRTSIVVLCQCADRKILFPGDVTPKRLELITKILKESTGNNDGFKLDFMVLPHHGSYRNLNRAIMQNVKCTNFIISTNSKKYFLPNKRAILKVIKYLNRNEDEVICFFFNYHETLGHLGISEDEKRKFNFLTPQNYNREYGLVI